MMVMASPEQQGPAWWLVAADSLAVGFFVGCVATGLVARAAFTGRPRRSRYQTKPLFPHRAAGLVGRSEHVLQHTLSLAWRRVAGAMPAWAHGRPRRHWCAGPAPAAGAAARAIAFVSTASTRWRWCRRGLSLLWGGRGHPCSCPKRRLSAPARAAAQEPPWWLWRWLQDAVFKDWQHGTLTSAWVELGPVLRLAFVRCVPRWARCS